MSVLWAERWGMTLRPVGAVSSTALAKLPMGRELRVEVRRPRNPRFLRLYWEICERVADAVGTEADVISDLLKIETGHFFLVRSNRYGDLRIAKSIAFAAMDETAFREFFDACVVAISANWGATKPEVVAAVEDLL